MPYITIAALIMSGNSSLPMWSATINHRPTCAPFQIRVKFILRFPVFNVISLRFRNNMPESYGRCTLLHSKIEGCGDTSPPQWKQLTNDAKSNFRFIPFAVVPLQPLTALIAIGALVHRCILHNEFKFIHCSIARRTKRFTSYDGLNGCAIQVHKSYMYTEWTIAGLVVHFYCFKYIHWNIHHHFTIANSQLETRAVHTHAPLPTK